MLDSSEWLSLSLSLYFRSSSSCSLYRRGDSSSESSTIRISMFGSGEQQVAREDQSVSILFTHGWYSPGAFGSSVSRRLERAFPSSCRWTDAKELAVLSLLVNAQGCLRTVSIVGHVWHTRGLLAFVEWMEEQIVAIDPTATIGNANSDDHRTDNFVHDDTGTCGRRSQSSGEQWCFV